MKRQFLNKKQESNYLAIYDEYRRKYTQGYETGYYRLRDQFGDNVGLPYNVISSGDYDPTTITTPLPTLAHTISPATYTVAPFTVGNYQTVGYNDSLVWGIDRYYLFNITSNGNDFKLGFYGGNQPLSFTSTSSTYPPDFYYESSTGSIYMGNVLLKNIGANKTTLMIRIDSNYNFYIGTALNNYWLIGNCLTNMSIINNDTYTIRWGYEVKSNGGSNTTFNLVSSSYSDLPNILTDGISWPNYRLGGVLNSNRMAITDTVDQSNANFRVYQVLNYSNDVTSLGQRTSFTLRNISGSFDQVVIFITQNPLSQPTYTRTYDIVTETSLNFLSYDSLTNSYAIPPSQSTPSSWPNLNNVNGQIYFRIEEDGKIYSSRDKSNAALIGTLSYSKFYIYVCTKGYSGNKTGTLSFIQHDAQAVLANPTLDPSILRAPMIDRTSTLILPNGNTSDTVSMTAGNYYTTSVVDSTPLTYGLNIWYNVDLNNITNNFKIGFYTNTLINNHTQTSSSVNPPAFYYNTSDRGVYMGGVLKKTLPNDWTLVFLLLDHSLNFYVGYSDVFYYLIDNLNNYLPNIWPNTYTIRLGWEVHANTTSSYTINHIDGGYYQDPSYQLTWPNARIYNGTGDYSDQGVLQNETGLFKYVNFLNYSNTYIPQGSFTFQNVNTATNTEVIVVIFNDLQNSNGNTTGSYPTMLGSNHLIYKLSTNQIIYNGTSIGAPSSYPDLNTALGQIYWEFSGGQVYLSRDESNKVLLSGVSVPSGVLYGGVLTSSATTSSSTYKFIPNNSQAVVPPPGPPLPPSSGSSIPAPTVGTYSSVQAEHATKWTLSYPVTPGQETLIPEEISYGQAYADKWQSTVVFNFTVTNFKIGVGYVCTTPIRNDLGGYNVNPKRPWDTSNYYLYYYYDSTNGYIYKNNVVVYALPSGLTTVGFSIDEYYNVYVVTATDYYNVGSYSPFNSSNTNNQTGITYGIVVTPPSSPFFASSNYTLNTSRTKIYATLGNGIYSLDGIYNRIMYDVISTQYKQSITASSTTNYKFVECRSNYAVNAYAFNYRYMFRFTVAPTDVVLLWGRSIPTFVPGTEYSLSQIQTPVQPSYGCITYVSSTSTFYANTTSRQVLNLNLSVNNTTLYFDQDNSSVNFNAGANFASKVAVPVGKGTAPLTQTSNFYYPFVGFFIKTSSPSTYCQIDAIAVA